MNVVYNEFDRRAAAWLRELIASEHIEPGTIDERSISDLAPADCTERMHFFAGIGGWPYALDLAGFPRSTAVWTGSCPCQPFSVAGKRKGTADARHLWPVWRELIRECRPAVVLGEQVASRDGRDWLTGVRADLEAMGYAVGAADLCAAGVGSPQIRQRLYWGGVLADAPGRTDCRVGGILAGHARGEGEQGPKLAYAGGDVMLGSPGLPRLARRSRQSSDDGPQLPAPERASCDAGDVGSADGGGFRIYLQRHGDEVHDATDGGTPRTDADRSGTAFWDAYDVLWCRDEKARRVEPGSFPLVDGLPGRVGLLRGYGNAIVPQLAAVFVKAFCEAAGEGEGNLRRGEDGGGDE